MAAGFARLKNRSPSRIDKSLEVSIDKHDDGGRDTSAFTLTTALVTVRAFTSTLTPEGCLPILLLGRKDRTIELGLGLVAQVCPPFQLHLNSVDSRQGQFLELNLAQLVDSDMCEVDLLKVRSAIRVRILGFRHPRCLSAVTRRSRRLVLTLPKEITLGVGSCIRPPCRAFALHGAVAFLPFSFGYLT